MIKINLGKARKHAPAASGGTGAGIDLKNLDVKDLFGFLKNLGAKSGGGGGGGGEKFDVKNSPILKLVLVAVAIFLVDDTLTNYKKEELAKVDKQIAKVDQEINTIQSKLAVVKGFEAKKAQLLAYEQALRTKLETLGKLMEGRTAPPKILMQLSQTIPSEVWLSEYKLSDLDLAIAGQTPSYSQVSDFIKELSASSYFTDVTLKGVEESSSPTKEQKIQNFSISARRRAM